MMIQKKDRSLGAIVSSDAERLCSMSGESLGEMIGRHDRGESDPLDLDTEEDNFRARAQGQGPTISKFSLVMDIWVSTDVAGGPATVIARPAARPDAHGDQKERNVPERLSYKDMIVLAERRQAQSNF